MESLKVINNQFSELESNPIYQALIVDSVESIVTVDDLSKMKVPTLMVQKVQDQFEKDIKEIITIKQEEQKEGVLIILNMEPVTTRIKHSISA